MVVVYSLSMLWRLLLATPPIRIESSSLGPSPTASESLSDRPSLPLEESWSSSSSLVALEDSFIDESPDDDDEAEEEVDEEEWEPPDAAESDVAVFTRRRLVDFSASEEAPAPPDASTVTAMLGRRNMAQKPRGASAAAVDVDPGVLAPAAPASLPCSPG